MALPYADKIFPSTTFDMRKALAIHAQGISRVATNTDQRSPRDKALHPERRAVFAATHLPLVLQVVNRGVCAHAGPAQNIV